MSLDAIFKVYKLAVQQIILSRDIIEIYIAI